MGLKEKQTIFYLCIYFLLSAHKNHKNMQKNIEFLHIKW